MPRNRELVWCFSLMSFLPALNGWAQTQTLMDSNRPVADATVRIEQLYGWPIAYEDPPYVYDGDFEDATSRVRRDGKSAADGVPRVLLPRGRSFTLTLENVARPVRGARSSEVSARAAIQAMLKSYSESVGTEMFTLGESNGIFQVIPVQRRDTLGSMEKIVPILDTPLSLQPRQRTVTDLLNEICHAVSQKTGEKVSFVSQPRTGPTYITPKTGETARSILSRLLAEQSQVLPISWKLLYQPGWGYALNLVVVDTSK